MSFYLQRFLALIRANPLVSASIVALLLAAAANTYLWDRRNTLAKQHDDARRYGEAMRPALSSFTRLSAQVATTQEAVELIERNLIVEAELADTGARADDADSRAIDAQARAGTAEGDLAQTRKRLAELETALAAANAAAKATDTRLAAAEAQIAEAQARFEAAAAHAVAKEQALASAEAEQAAFDPLLARIESLVRTAEDSAAA